MKQLAKKKSQVYHNITVNSKNKKISKKNEAERYRKP